MELWQEFEIERETYYHTFRNVTYDILYSFRVEYSYMYFDEDIMGEDEFSAFGDFETLQQAIEFKELLEKVKLLDIPRLDESTYLIGDVKIYKIVFETRELIT